MFIIITFLRSSWLPGKSLTCSLRNNGECREYSTSFGIIHDSLKNFLRWPMGAYASERISRVQQVTFDLPTEWNWVKQKYFYFRQLALPCSWATRITFPFLISKFYREVIIIKIISLSPKVNSLGVLTTVFYRGKRKIYTCFGTNNNVPDISDLRSGEKQWLHFVAQTHGGGEGGTPLHKPVVQYVLPQRIYFFFAPFWTENGHTFCPFSSRIE